jgi:Tfp pilus assembly pilus retraction ATPase PilT
MNSRLKNSALSEDVIKLMKERRSSLIQERQKDMETRIYKNLNRRAEREDDQVKN